MNEQALLAAVLDDYDDDAPRLIMADWWEENGQSERAEFIRVQCAIATMEHPQRGFLAADMKMPGGKRIRRRLAKERERRWEALRRREGELLGNHKHEWLPLPSNNNTYGHRAGFIVGNNQGEFIFRRGFVFHVACTAADWLEHGDAILAAAPVEEVTLTTWPFFDHSGDPASELDCQVQLRLRWGKVRYWHLPPAESVYCRRCGAQATHYTEARLDVTSWHDATPRTIPGLRTAYCTAHAPAGAAPMPPPDAFPPSSLEAGRPRHRRRPDGLYEVTYPFTIRPPTIFHPARRGG